MFLYYFSVKTVFETLNYHFLIILWFDNLIFKTTTLGQDIKTCSHEWYK